MGEAEVVRLRSRCSARGLGGVEGWDVLDRHPADALVDMVASAAERTALLVMATHGRTGWDRLRLGSVTTATVHGSAVPVLVVPAVPGRGRNDGRAAGPARRHGVTSAVKGVSFGPDADPVGIVMLVA